MDFSGYNFSQLKLLVKQTRAFAAMEADDFNVAFKKIILEKTQNKEFDDQFTDFSFFLLENVFFVNAFTDYGINSNRGFFPEMARRLKHKILPANIPDNELVHVINYLFNKRSDYIWLQKINYENWSLLFDRINVSQLESHSAKMGNQICNAIIVLCHRLTTMGIDPYLVSKMPEIDDNDSPFFELNHQVSVFVKKHQADSSLSIDYAELNLVLHSINRCELLFKSLQSKKDEIGTSLHLTFLLKRAEQHISRVKLLLRLYLTKEYGDKTQVVSQLLVELVKAIHTKNRVKSFVKENTQLLAYRIVSHTSEKGEHYIGFSKNENYKLFRSALGGGLVVVFLVYIKHWIHDWHLSLFFEGLLFGLNYGLGFVLMHLLHLTLATKQPAMTASYIAENIGNSNVSNIKSWMVFKQILRSQFISLIGNLVIVLPLCFLSSWLLIHYFDHSVFDPTEAKAQMYSNHPFYSGSLIYACFTGVFLSLSGIIIGYFDNKVVYSEISARIIKHPKLANYGLAKRKRIAAFFERNLGAIVGNLFLGFCLGMAGNIGKFIGIPLDIRHITISAGNFGIALGGQYDFGFSLILTVFVGVLLIGIVNIASSFLISFVMACQSRGLSWKQSLKVLMGIT